jgi:hypothetical protein
LEFRSGSSDLPDAGIAGGSSHTATAGMAIHGAGAEVIAKLAELAMADGRSPLFAAGNAGVLARGGRLCRRDDESRSESYADILYDPEDTIRFYALRLREAGIIKSKPQKIIADGTDWRFLNEVKRELKA